MSGYYGVNLIDILNDSELGENAAKSILSNFSCPLNSDVEDFLKNKSIMFSRQSISSTYLIMASYQKQNVHVGYFTLANKMFCISKDSLPNSKWRRRIAKFGQYDTTLKKYLISAPLIGQLGKNYTNKYNELITGDELLLLALKKVEEMQRIVGGKIVYLECEDKKQLVDFYSRNGFVNFGIRYLDKDESNLSGDYLLQMLKFLDGQL